MLKKLYMNFGDSCLIFLAYQLYIIQQSDRITNIEPGHKLRTEWIEIFKNVHISIETDVSIVAYASQHSHYRNMNMVFVMD